jgi:hypothetical protein
VASPVPTRKSTECELNREFDSELQREMQLGVSPSCATGELPQDVGICRGCLSDSSLLETSAERTTHACFDRARPPPGISRSGDPQDLQMCLSVFRRV